MKFQVCRSVRMPTSSTQSISSMPSSIISLSRLSWSFHPCNDDSGSLLLRPQCCITACSTERVQPPKATIFPLRLASSWFFDFGMWPTWYPSIKCHSSIPNAYKEFSYIEPSSR